MIEPTRATNPRLNEMLNGVRRTVKAQETAGEMLGRDAKGWQERAEFLAGMVKNAVSAGDGAKAEAVFQALGAAIYMMHPGEASVMEKVAPSGPIPAPKPEKGPKPTPAAPKPTPA